MEPTPNIPRPSDELKAVLHHIILGKPIDQPSQPGSGMKPLDWYIQFLGKNNSIFPIIQNRQAMNITVTRSHRTRGLFHVSLDPSGPVVTFHTKYICNSTPVTARTSRPTRPDGPVKGGDDGNSARRLCTNDEVRTDIERVLLQTIEKMSRLADFVATSWRMSTDDPKHPLWRPVGSRLVADPFEPGLPDITTMSEFDLNSYDKLVLFNRRIAGYEKLYRKMENIMNFIFIVGRADDKGASLSDEGKDIFTANVGLIDDFVYLHFVYMKQNIVRIKGAEIKNLLDLNECILQLNYESVLDDFGSLGM